MNWLWRALLGDTPVPPCGIPRDVDPEAELPADVPAPKSANATPDRNKVR